MLEYAEGCVGTPFADLGADALDEIVFEAFPRKVTCEPAVAPDIIRSLRAFWTFARSARPPAGGGLPRDPRRGRRPRLARALADPSNFGMAKAFAMAAALPGVAASTPGRPVGSSKARERKRKARKLRKQAQRRNRR